MKIGRYRRVGPDLETAWGTYASPMIVGDPTSIRGKPWIPPVLRTRHPYRMQPRPLGPLAGFGDAAATPETLQQETIVPKYSVSALPGARLADPLLTVNMALQECNGIARVVKGIFEGAMTMPPGLNQHISNLAFHGQAMKAFLEAHARVDNNASELASNANGFSGALDLYFLELTKVDSAWNAWNATRQAPAVVQPVGVRKLRIPGTKAEVLNIDMTGGNASAMLPKPSSVQKSVGFLIFGGVIAGAIWLMK